jgi:ankyrin repeat protein
MNTATTSSADSSSPLKVSNTNLISSMELLRSQGSYPEFQLSLFDSGESTRVAIENASLSEINETDYNGNTSLMFASSEGREDLVQVLLISILSLMNMLVTCRSRSRYKPTKLPGRDCPLLGSCSWLSQVWDPTYKYDYLIFFRICEFLLLNGANPNIGNIEGTSPAHMAAAGGHLDTLLRLAARGAYLNNQDEEGDTPLHYAVRESQQKAVEFLVRDLKCDVDMQNEDSETPIQLAMCLGEAEMVQFLALHSKSQSVSKGQPNWNSQASDAQMAICV